MPTKAIDYLTQKIHKPIVNTNKKKPSPPLPIKSFVEIITRRR
jgi:hypothetical protein